MTDSFPRQQARTRRFSLGVPRSFRVSPDGRRVVFLRSRSGTDPVTCLWRWQPGPGDADLIADPAALDADEADLPEQEKARRERVREQAGGIVSYSTDRDLTRAAFTLGGQLYLARLDGPGGPGSAGGAGGPGGAQPVAAQAPVLDPRLDPAGQRIGYVAGGALHVLDLRDGRDTVLAGPGTGPEGAAGGQDGAVYYGLAEFVAAEEMGRTRGYWWAPDGSAILVARVDETPVQRWHIADPANPARPGTVLRYPAAGTPNADVSLLMARLDGGRAEVGWDRAEFPYLVTVSWDSGDPLIVVQSRDQRRLRLLGADAASGGTTVIREDTDERWVDIVPGVPARTGGGRIAWVADVAGSRRLLVASAAEHAAGTAAPVTPAALNVREVAAVDGETVLFTASAADPAQVGLYRAGPEGPAELSPPGGVHGGTQSGGTTVLVSHTLDADGPVIRVLRDGAEAGRIGCRAEQPALPPPHPDLFAAGARQIRSALLLPSWHRPGAARLPVLLDPYGGPHAQRVLAARGAFLTSQWFAEQGFAVLVADGRGTPGRGPAWDRAVWHDFAGPVLEDQVAALHEAAARCPDLDTGRVAIRGWSFGGYLAALAVLRRPDVFQAAVAGAPVTDWQLYDTHYTERYLGHPDDQPQVYAKNSLLADAPRLTRPLLLIHGLADDNVVAAHTLRLSAALLAAGRPHSVLPLSGVTHMTPQEEVAENLLLLQVDFLRRALGLAAGPPPRPV
jgi:dipeptidyl-peptidase-4